MADKINYQLNTEALNDIENLTNIIDLLEQNHHYIKSHSFEQNHPIFSQHDQFEVIYDKDKSPDQGGNISPRVLRDLLVEIQVELVSSAKDTSVYLPPVKNSPNWNKFYFQGVYKDSTDSGSLKEIIDTLHAVVHGSLKKKDEDSGTDNKAGDISEFSLTFRQGNLIENWSKEGNGVLAFANHLLSIKKYGRDTLLIEGALFGRPKDEYYYFGNALGALSVYHKEFKDYIKGHPNFKHPKGSDERKTLDKLIDKSEPFFSGRGIILLDSYIDEGKLTTDDTALKEFINIFKAALKALGEKVPEEPTGAGGDEDADGGAEEDDPDDKKDDKNLISFGDLYNLIRSKLISFIYETYYQEEVKKQDLSNQSKIRLLLFTVINNGIDPNIDLRGLIREKWNSDWQTYLEEDEIDLNKELGSDIESFVEKQANSNSFDFESAITEDIKFAIDNISGTKDPESDTPLTEIDFPSTSNKIAFRLREKDKDTFSEKFNGEAWDDLDTKQKVNFWKTLTLRERRQFLEDNNLMDYVDKYLTDISTDYLNEQLAKKSISLSESSNFTSLLNEMRAQIREDLFSIPPTEFGDDTEIFKAKMERKAFFFRMEERWNNEFSPLFDKEITKFSRDNPQIISYEFIQGKTFNEIASELNQKNTGNAGEDLIDEAAGLILIGILKDLGVYKGVKLDSLDRDQSVREIGVYLRLYLRKNDIDNLFYLYSGAKLDSFVRNYTHKLLISKGAFFLPLIEDRMHQAHREDIFQKIRLKIGSDLQTKINVDNTLYSILTQAALSQVNPEDYINELTTEEIDSLFEISKKGHTFSDKDYEDFRALLIKYMDESRKALHLDDIITEPGELDKEEFEDGTLFLREQAREISKQRGGGRIIYSAITSEPSEEEDLIALEDETELEALARQDQIRQKIMALAIYAAYSEEQKALLEQQNAKELAIYNWEKILNKDAAEKGEQRSKKKKKSLLKKGIDKGLDKAVIGASTTALGAVPIIGTVAAGLINFLPIPDKYKKYVAVGGAALMAAYLFKVFTSIGGWLGGSIGGLLGFFFSGIGVVPGVLIGANAGFLLEQAIRGNLAGFGDWISNSAGNVGNFFNQLGDGMVRGANYLGNGAVNLAKSSFNTTAHGIGQLAEGIGTVPGTFVQVFTGSIAAAAITTTLITLLIGGVATTEKIHTAFLQRVPELSSYSDDSSSKYVDLNKRANPSTMKNDKTRDITYSITITPQEGYIITVDQVIDQITILGSNSSNDTFNVEPAQVTEQLQPSTEISSPITIEYTLPNVSGTDIALNNTFILDFFVEENGEILEESVRDSSIVTIGDPELGCFVFGEAGVSVRGITTIEWAENEKNLFINSYSKLIGNSTYMGLTCSDGTITLYRLNGFEYGGWALSPSSIGLYDLGMWVRSNGNRVLSQNVADYTLFHELGHLIDYRNPGLRSSFEANRSSTSCFTYPATCKASEAFPEALSLYAVSSYYNFPVPNSSPTKYYRYDFPGLNPTEYNWVENNIYGGGF